jgi:hypothetical protein
MHSDEHGHDRMHKIYSTSQSVQVELNSLRSPRAEIDALGRILSVLDRLTRDDLDSDGLLEIEPYRDAVKKASSRYLLAYMEYIEQLENLRMLYGPSEMRSIYENLRPQDIARRHAHDAIIGALRAYIDKLVYEIDLDAAPYAPFLKDPLDSEVRQEIGKIALIHAFDMMMTAYDDGESHAKS